MHAAPPGKEGLLSPRPGPTCPTGAVAFSTAIWRSLGTGTELEREGELGPMGMTLISKMGVRKVLVDKLFSVPAPTQLVPRYGSSCKLSEVALLYLLSPLSYLIPLFPSPASQNVKC